jgi:hypothetical protein
LEVKAVERRPAIEKCFGYFLKQVLKKDMLGRGEMVVFTSGIKEKSDKPSGSIKLLSA